MLSSDQMAVTAQLKNCKTELSACKQVSRKYFLRTCLICKYQNHQNKTKPTFSPQVEDDGRGWNEGDVLLRHLEDSHRELRWFLCQYIVLGHRLEPQVLLLKPPPLSPT